MEDHGIDNFAKGRLVIGLSQTSFLVCLPKIFTAFQARFPAVTLELHQGSRRDIVNGLNGGCLDAGFTDWLDLNDNLNALVVYDEAFGALLFTMAFASGIVLAETGFVPFSGCYRSFSLIWSDASTNPLLKCFVSAASDAFFTKEYHADVQ